jgi:hypothetical protein
MTLKTAPIEASLDALTSCYDTAIFSIIVNRES